MSYHLDYYRCEGPIRGRCGHRHRTLQGAVSCLCRDRSRCKRQGGYSDRQIFRVTNSVARFVDVSIRSEHEWCVMAAGAQ